MKKRYFLFIILALMGIVFKVKALEINDCKVMVIIKETSGEDTEKYICSGKKYGEKNDNIYYPGKGNIIYLNNYNSYYLSNADMNIKISIKGDNKISYLHVGNKNKIEVMGNGSLKFRDYSIVNKYVNAKPIYYYKYNDKVVINEDKKVYEGTIEEFLDIYNDLIKINKLPKEYDEEKVIKMQLLDFSKLSPVSINESWIDNNIVTNLKVSVNNGYGYIYYKEPSNELSTDEVVLISKDKVDSKYELNVDNLKNHEITDKISEDLDNKDIVSFYNVSITDEKNNKSINKGEFTIKLKMNEEFSPYEDYQIIYVDDEGNIKEYLSSSIEGDYIVFNTNHLSYYGVIGTEKPVLSIEANDESISKMTIVMLVVMISIILSFGALILFILMKSNLLHKRKHKRKRVVKTKLLES